MSQAVRPFFQVGHPGSLKRSVTKVRMGGLAARERHGPRTEEITHAVVPGPAASSGTGFGQHQLRYEVRPCRCEQHRRMPAHRLTDQNDWLTHGHLDHLHDVGNESQAGEVAWGLCAAPMSAKVHQDCDHIRPRPARDFCLTAGPQKPQQHFSAHLRQRLPGGQKPPAKRQKVIPVGNAPS